MSKALNIYLLSFLFYFYLFFFVAGLFWRYILNYNKCKSNFHNFYPQHELFSTNGNLKQKSHEYLTYFSDFNSISASGSNIHINGGIFFLPIFQFVSVKKSKSIVLGMHSERTKFYLHQFRWLITYHVYHSWCNFLYMLSKIVILGRVDCR